MEQLYTITEACKLLRVSRDTIYRWMRTGELPYVIVGHDRRIRESDIRALIRKPAETPPR